MRQPPPNPVVCEACGKRFNKKVSRVRHVNAVLACNRWYATRNRLGELR